MGEPAWICCAPMMQLRPALLVQVPPWHAWPLPQLVSSGSEVEPHTPRALQSISVQAPGAPQVAPVAPATYLHLPSAGSQYPGPRWQSGGELQPLGVPPWQMPFLHLPPVLHTLPSEQPLPSQLGSEQSMSWLQFSSIPSVQLVSAPDRQALQAPATQ